MIMWTDILMFALGVICGFVITSVLKMSKISDDKAKKFRTCTECKYFISCESGKQIYHKVTETPCDMFEEGGF